MAAKLHEPIAIQPLALNRLGPQQLPHKGAQVKEALLEVLVQAFKRLRVKPLELLEAVGWRRQASTFQGMECPYHVPPYFVSFGDLSARQRWIIAIEKNSITKYIANYFYI